MSHERSGARAAARANRNALCLRPLNEVGDDEEIAGIFHAFDHVELEGEAFAVFLDRAPGRDGLRLDPALEPRLGTLAQLRAFVDRGARFAHREARQDRCLHARAKRAALGNFYRVTQRLRQIGEQLRHFRPRLEAMLGRAPAPFGLDADERVVGLVVLARGEKRLVGGNQRNAVRICEVYQERLTGALGAGAVALQLDIEPIAE